MSQQEKSAQDDDFSKRVRAYREKEGISQEELAKRMGISRNYVSMIESGQAPSDQLVRHFKLLELSPTATARIRLKIARERSGLSQAELARKIGYDLGVVVAVEDGTARASERMIDRICEVIAVDKEDLMAGSDAPRIMDESGREGTFGATPNIDLPPGSRARYVPLLSWAQAGALGSGHLDDAYDYGGTISIDIKDRRAFGLRIRGDSMVPEIREGDDAIVCPSWQPRNGDTVIARTVDGDVMCKIYQTKEGGQRIVLSSYNPAHPPIELSREEVAWIYPVGQVVRNYRKQ